MMTTACAISLGLSLVLYLGATLCSHAHLLFAHRSWEKWGLRLLMSGWIVQAVGMTLHFAFSGEPPLSSMLVLVSLVTLALLAAALLGEYFLRARHVSLIAAPLAFFALLYALLMPVRFDTARHILLRHPWLGIHVGFTLLGYIGFAVAFCGAVAYLAQNRALKNGRLNRYLPSLNAAASVTFRFAAGGFWLFTMGLIMGLVWQFTAPDEYLRAQDPKIWIALPIWAAFAVYLYQRGVARRHGSHLKWLVILGFVLALVNLLGVRHQFRAAESSPPEQQGDLHL